MKSLIIALCTSITCFSCKIFDSKPVSGLRDTGWVSSTSVEVESIMTGTVTAAESMEFSKLSTDVAQQEKLVDMQVKFAKGFFHDKTMQLNQIPEKITITDVKKNGQDVSITYSAVIDILAPVKEKQPVPTLETIGATSFTVPVPENPLGLMSRANLTCVTMPDPKILTEEKYYYYFDSKKPECKLPLINNQVTFSKIYPVPAKVYPEYDKLMLNLAENGVEFHAAIVPDSEDGNPLGRYNQHLAAIKLEELVGVPSADGAYTRFVWKNGSAAIVIDLFDPTKGDSEEIFIRALGKYEYVFFNGHAAYGTRDFVANRNAFSKSYQVIVLHSCRSYPYYSRQILQGKSSPQDPNGFASTDIIATGETSQEYDSPTIMMMSLRNLLMGISSVAEKNPSAAPDWNSIAFDMNDEIPNTFYGMAGVRTNAWKP